MLLLRPSEPPPLARGNNKVSSTTTCLDQTHRKSEGLLRPPASVASPPRGILTKMPVRFGQVHITMFTTDMSKLHHAYSRLSIVRIPRQNYAQSTMTNHRKSLYIVFKWDIPEVGGKLSLLTIEIFVLSRLVTKKLDIPGMRGKLLLQSTRRRPMYFPIRWSLLARPEPDNTFWTDSTYYQSQRYCPTKGGRRAAI